MDIGDILNQDLDGLKLEHDKKLHPEKYKTSEQLLKEK